jgi:hypothetical protein
LPTFQVSIFLLSNWAVSEFFFTTFFQL